MTADPRLLPCPLCGGGAVGAVVAPSTDSAYYEVGCSLCCISISSRASAPEVAIAAWNRREREARLVALLRRNVDFIEASPLEGAIDRAAEIRTEIGRSDAEQG